MALHVRGPQRHRTQPSSRSCRCPPPRLPFAAQGHEPLGNTRRPRRQLANAPRKAIYARCGPDSRRIRQNDGQTTACEPTPANPFSNSTHDVNSGRCSGRPGIAARSVHSIIRTPDPVKSREMRIPLYSIHRENTHSHGTGRRWKTAAQRDGQTHSSPVFKVSYAGSWFPDSFAARLPADAMCFSARASVASRSPATVGAITTCSICLIPMNPNASSR